MRLLRLVKEAYTRDRVPSIIASLIIAICALVFCVVASGCGESEREKKLREDTTKQQQQAIDQAAQGAANIEPIGLHLETSGRKAEGAALLTQVDLLVNALSNLAKTLGLNISLKVPTVSYSEWQAAKDDAQKSAALATRLGAEADQLKASLDTKTAEIEELRKVVEEEKKQGWWRKLTSGGFITFVTGASLLVARALNIPGVGLLTDPLLRLISRPVVKPIEEKAAQLESKASTAATAVMASDIARAGIRLLDAKLKESELGSKLTAFISERTGGRAGSIEDVFVNIAKGVAIDEGSQPQVDALLSEIRNDKIETKLGEPSMVAHLFRN